ncbi:MAG: sigma-E factor negative regulatory protein [Gammaproteobacteria bacterium]
MSDLLREQISAFMDGELPEEECALLVKRLGASAELTERWHLYHLLGDTLRDESVPQGAHAVAARVEQALAGPPVLHEVPARRRPARWNMRRTATMAASVAVLGLAGLTGALVMRQMAGGGQVLVPGAANNAAQSSSVQHVDLRQAPQPVRAEMNRYLLMHQMYGAGAMLSAVGKSRSTAASSIASPSGHGGKP